MYIKRVRISKIRTWNLFHLDHRITFSLFLITDDPVINRILYWKITANPAFSSWSIIIFYAIVMFRNYTRKPLSAYNLIHISYGLLIVARSASEIASLSFLLITRTVAFPMENVARRKEPMYAYCRHVHLLHGLNSNGLHLHCSAPLITILVLTLIGWSYVG